MRRRLLISVVAAVAVLAPTAAYGFWTMSSTNVNGAARAGVVGAPTIGASLNGGDVRISVSAPGTGPVPTTYRVDRTSPSAQTNVCTITANTSGVGTCLDTNPSILSTNTYRVYASVGSFTAIGANAPSTDIYVGLLSRALTVAVGSNVVAGTPTTLTLTATVTGLQDIGFSGVKNLLITGAANSPNGTAPTFPVTATFVNGAATVSVTLTNAASTTLTVVSDSRSGTSGAFNVGANVASSYTLAGPSTAQAGIAYTLSTVTAKDAYGNTATGWTGSKVLTWGGAGAAVSGGATPTASTSPTFITGVASNVALTFVRAETVPLTATTGGVITPTPLSVTVSGGLPAKAGFTGMSSPTGGTVTCATTVACTGTALGNDGAVAGQITFTDAYGNTAGNAGTGYTLEFTATQSRGSGAFTAGGTTAASRTITVPSTGSSAVTWSYAHNGEADWTDVVTIKLIKNSTVESTITATLYKTN